MPPILHPILQESFRIIDREMDIHGLSPEEHAIVRRVIHSTADFEFQHLIRFSPGAITAAIAALTQQTPIVTDVSMVTVGIQTLVQQTFGNPVITAVSQGQEPPPGQTRTEAGLLRCLEQFPTAIYVIGNAPTALLALCQHSQAPPSQPCPQSGWHPPLPACIIGAPVGFVAVEAAKDALAQTAIPHIRIEGRKGGSPASAAILNALLMLAWHRQGLTVAGPMSPIHVVGIGLAGLTSLTEATRTIISQASLLVGSERHLSYVTHHPGPRLILTDLNQTLAQIHQRLQSQPDAPIVILVSGDPLFFGLGRLLLTTSLPLSSPFIPM